MGITNGEFVEACADDVWGTVDLPAVPDLLVTDVCSNEINVTFTEVGVGEYAPLEDGTTFCAATTPGVMPDGQTCDNYDAHAVRIFNLPGEQFYTIVDGVVTNHPDGTRTVDVTVVATENPNAGWVLQVDLNAELTWDEWIAQPGSQSYKSDCDLGDHTEWYYHVVQNSSTATGWGDYDGSVLSLSHQPSNEFYGWQFGVGANNKNANFGYWGWFYWEGVIDGQFEAGSGSMHADLDCTMPYDIDRTYVATDCGGNATTFSYTVAVNGGGCQPPLPPYTGNPGIDVDWGDQETDNDSEIFGGLGDPNEGKDPLKVLNLAPNPTDEHALFQFISEERLQVAVQLFDMTGVMQSTLYEGTVEAGQRYQLEVNVASLPAGMYQIRIVSSVQIVNTKLLVMD
jgi:hypothetical protein